jgi:NitT/TauT family transport system substrate-binding protein
MNAKIASKIPVLILLTIALLIQACAPAAPQAAPSEAPAAAGPVKLKVAVQPFITFVPYYIAQQEGYFAEQGLEVELVNFEQSEQVVPALASGQVDVSSGLVSAGMFNAIAKSGNMMITSDKGYIDPDSECPSYAIIARSDLVSEINSPADLEGRKLDTVPATFLEFYLAKVLARAGLTTQDATISNLPTTAESEAFVNKVIDVTTNSEPWIVRLTNEGHQVVLDTARETLPGHHGAVQLYGARLLEDKDLGNRFMAAYLRGAQQYNEGKTDRNVQLTAEFTKLPEELLKAICWSPLKADGQVNAESLVEFQNWAKEAGYLETVLSPDQFLDGSFVEFNKGQ